jgi:hypothetical protein
MFIERIFLGGRTSHGYQTLPLFVKSGLLIADERVGAF